MNNHPHPNPPPEGEGMSSKGSSPTPEGGQEGGNGGNLGSPCSFTARRRVPPGTLRGKVGMGAVVLLFALLLAPLAQAQVGHVVTVQGTAIVERAGQSPRVLGPGEKLLQKDVINVAQNSNAVLEFRDKSRITLRPNTVFRVDSYSDTAPQGMVLGLVKGGFRAVTGDIGKANPQAVRFQTDTVILGIRGTEFDARLCADDCAQEERTMPLQRVRSVAAARVIELSGEVTATGASGLSRTLVPGAVVNEGESIATAAGANAQIALLDGSRITLAERGHLLIARFQFDPASPQRGLGHMRLLSGNAHVWTGQLAKIGPDAFLFETTRGMIRPQGTGFSVSGDDVIVVHTWDGSVIIQTSTERIELPKTATAAIAVVDGKITFLPKPPAHLLAGEALGHVTVDPATFGQGGPPPEEGLYVWVREGAVTLGTGPQLVEVTAGNAIRAGGTGAIVRLPAIPNFMRFDLTPRPGLPNVGNVLPFFRASDGAIVGMCSAK